MSKTRWLRWAGGLVVSSRMLKKPASGVLASLRGSTYRGMPLGYRSYWRGFSVRQDQLRGRTAHTKCGTYLLASSLAAALPAERRVLTRRGWAGVNRDFFEHPDPYVTSTPLSRVFTVYRVYTEFFSVCSWQHSNYVDSEVVATP